MRLYLTIFFLSAFGGCMQNNKLPHDILPQEKMRNVIWDLMRADEYTGNFIMKDTTRNRKTESAKLYEQIFRIHEITHEQFKKSLMFYESRPDLLKSITDSLNAVDKIAIGKEYQDKYSKPTDTIIKNSKIMKTLVE